MREAFSRYIYYPLAQKVKGHKVLDYLKELLANERLSGDELHDLQAGKLKEHLKTAAHSPFYSRMFKETGFDPENDYDKMDLLPLTTKMAILENPESLHNPTYQGPRVQGRTSGTTGISLPVYYDSEWDQRNQAAQLRGRAWWKIYPGTRELDVWGRPFDSKQAEWIGKFKMGMLNKKILSCFELGDHQLDAKMPELIRYNPEVIYSYTTGVGRLAEYLWEKYGGDGPLKPRVVIITSEMLLEPHRLAMVGAFGAEPVNEYGAVEGGIIAFQCPEGNWHLFADNLIVEIVDPDQEGNGKVVITPLANRAMPLVRYEIGDIGRFAGGKCSCGRNLPMFELSKGRISDVVETPRGKVASTDFFDFMAKSLIPHGLRQFRIIQKSLTHLHIQMVHSKEKDVVTEKMVESQVHQYLGADIRVTIEYLESLEPEKSGKLRYYIREDF